MINSKDISKNSKIIDIRNIDNIIKIFLNDGRVINIKNKKLIEVNNLGIRNIIKISFQDGSMLVYTESGKTVIF